MTVRRAPFTVYNPILRVKTTPSRCAGDLLQKLLLINLLITAAECCSVGEMLSIGKGLWAHILTGSKAASREETTPAAQTPRTPHVMLLPLPPARDMTTPRATSTLTNHSE